MVPRAIIKIKGVQTQKITNMPQAKISKDSSQKHKKARRNTVKVLKADRVAHLSALKNKTHSKLVRIKQAKHQ
jgi:hypothetical protein